MVKNWICEKCKILLPTIELNEIFGWEIYLCTPCIEKFLQPEPRDPEDFLKDRISKIDEIMKYLYGKFSKKWELDLLNQLLTTEKIRCSMESVKQLDTEILK